MSSHRKPAETEPLPVMVFMHGGGYILGSSATPIYDGVALARRGCVYVSVNYRLARWDVWTCRRCRPRTSPSTATCFCVIWCWRLRWVNDNIAVFGGDPDNVTMFGESAGAHAVAALLAAPDAEGLFAHAISESPASGMTRSSEVAAEFAARFADVARCPQAGRRRRADEGVAGGTGGRAKSPDRRRRARHAGRLPDRPRLR